jgi:hypothetical protein
VNLISVCIQLVIKDNLPHWPHTGDVPPVLTGEVAALLEDVVPPPLPAVVFVGVTAVVVTGKPPEAAIIAFFNGVNHAFSSFVFPELLGCTPSTVSVASS